MPLTTKFGRDQNDDLLTWLIPNIHMSIKLWNFLPTNQKLDTITSKYLNTQLSWYQRASVVPMLPKPAPGWYWYTKPLMKSLFPLDSCPPPPSREKEIREIMDATKEQKKHLIRCKIMKNADDEYTVWACNAHERQDTGMFPWDWEMKNPLKRMIWSYIICFQVKRNCYLRIRLWFVDSPISDHFEYFEKRLLV